MNLRRSVVIIAVGALFAVPAIAQEQYVLQMKFAPGEQSTTKITFTGVGTLTVDAPGVPDQPSDLSMSGRLELNEETKSVDHRGLAEVEWKLGALDADYQYLGVKQNVIFEDGQLQVTMDDQVVFDSLNPEQAKKYPMLALIGQGFVVKQDKTGKIVAIPQFELLLKMMMPESDLKTALEQSTGPLPPGPVKIGDTWEEREVWPYGVPEGMERPVFVTRHTLEALEPVGAHQCAKIAMVSNIDIKDMSMDLPTFMGPILGGVQPLSITVNTMAMDMTGTHYFDIERGTTLKMDAAITLNLDMKEMLQMPKQQQGQEQEEGATAETPEAQEMQQMEIGIKIEDLMIDIGLEVAQ